MSKQDRQGARTPAELERKYNFEKRFDDAMDAANEASKSVEKLDVKLDQTEVFNRLTKNGKAQGLYRDEEGNLFINASYLATGILKSRDGKTFFLDLDKGILKGQFSEFSIGGKSIERIATDAQKYADNAANKAVKNQSQTDVFNKLTNNGNAEGLFYQGGQLYINASYLVTGILQSLDATSFFLNLDDGTLKIGGKTVSWKDNGDGTFTLIGE